MTVTSAELRDNISKYLSVLAEEDIYITRHKKIVGVLTSPSRMKLRVGEEKEDLKEQFETYMQLTRDYLENIIKLLEKK